MSSPSYNHLSSYRIMFLFVFFDLPTKTASDKKAYATFRKKLQYSGFKCFQYSVYIRDCMTHELADKHTKQIKSFAPAKGHISILRVTEAQMLTMVNLYQNEEKTNPSPSPQLLLL